MKESMKAHASNHTPATAKKAAVRKARRQRAVSTIRRSGGARVMTVPIALLNAMKWDAGQEVELFASEDGLVVRPRKQLTLEDLMAQIPKDGLPSLEQLQGWDQPSEPAGDEVLP